MPPVRDASTKPRAATVLPAPVACSNQKRRAAPGPRAAPRLPPPRPPRPDPSRAAPRRAARHPRVRPRPSGAPQRWPRGGRCGTAGPRSSARSACPRARRPDARTASSRRQDVARPRTAGARGQGSARSCAATRPKAPRGRSRSPRVPRSARGGGRSRERARPVDPPSSTKGSRANSSARFRSSPKTGEASATELVSATGDQALLVRGTSRAGPSSLSGAARRVVALKTFPRAPTCQVPRWTAAWLLQHTKAEMGSASPSPGAPPQRLFSF